MIYALYAIGLTVSSVMGMKNVSSVPPLGRAFGCMKNSLKNCIFKPGSDVKFPKYENLHLQRPHPMLLEALEEDLKYGNRHLRQCGNLRTVIRKNLHALHADIEAAALQKEEKQEVRERSKAFLPPPFSDPHSKVKSAPGRPEDVPENDWKVLLRRIQGLVAVDDNLKELKEGDQLRYILDPATSAKAIDAILRYLKIDVNDHKTKESTVEAALITFGWQKEAIKYLIRERTQVEKLRIAGRCVNFALKGKVENFLWYLKCKFELEPSKKDVEEYFTHNEEIKNMWLDYLWKEKAEEFVAIKKEKHENLMAKIAPGKRFPMAAVAAKYVTVGGFRTYAKKNNFHVPSRDEEGDREIGAYLKELVRKMI